MSPARSRSAPGPPEPIATASGVASPFSRGSAPPHPAASDATSAERTSGREDTGRNDPPGSTPADRPSVFANGDPDQGTWLAAGVDARRRLQLPRFFRRGET